jgi:fucose permease
VALPAAALIKRYSYKVAIVIGLCLYALGCFLFVPAAQIMTYGAFLACLGVIACGLSFLETSANTYSSLLGPIQSSTQRINFSQIFNSLGVISGVLIGQVMVFGEHDPSHEQLLAMPAEMAEAARHQMVSQVVGPYLIIGSVLVVLALVLSLLSSRPARGTISAADARREYGADAETSLCAAAFSAGCPVAVSLRRGAGWRLEFHYSFRTACSAWDQRALRHLLAAGLTGYLCHR